MIEFVIKWIGVTLLIGLGIFLVLIVLGLLSIWGKKIAIKFKKKKIKKEDRKLRKYLMEFNENKLEVIDETPREVYIGDRFYVLKPLKYRQFTRICILMAKTLEKLGGLNIDMTQLDSHIGKVIEHSEDDFFKLLAYVLYFSNNENEDRDIKIIEGVESEFLYLKNHAELEEITRLLEVIAIQNDIDRALKAFGVLAPKKKIHPRR
jgi:hypothetical protein